VGVIWIEVGTGYTGYVTCNFVRATFPATSVVRIAIKLRPGVREMLQEKLPPVNETIVPLQVTLDIPDRASDMLPAAVTVFVEIVLPSAGAVTVRTGAVKSILRVTLVEAVFPTESVTVPLTI
jgi:hypothetical protein